MLLVEWMPFLKILKDENQEDSTKGFLSNLTRVCHHKMFSLNNTPIWREISPTQIGLNRLPSFHPICKTKIWTNLTWEGVMRKVWRETPHQTPFLSERPRVIRCLKINFYASLPTIYRNTNFPQIFLDCERVLVLPQAIDGLP